MVPSSELFVGLKFKKPPLTRSISFTMAFQDHQDFPVLPRGANFSPQREEKLEEVHSCGKITIINGKIHYKWPFSIAMLNYQRVGNKTHWKLLMIVLPTLHHIFFSWFLPIDDIHNFQTKIFLKDLKGVCLLRAKGVVQVLFLVTVSNTTLKRFSV